MIRTYMSIMLIPNQGGRVRCFRVPRISLFLVASVLAALCMLSVVGVVVSWRAQELGSQVRTLSGENLALRHHVVNLQVAVDAVEAKLRKAMVREKEARLLAGLEPIDDETRRLGVGGSGLAFSDAAPAQASEPLKNEVRRLSTAIDELDRRADFQLVSYREVTDRLRALGEELARRPTICPLRGRYFFSSKFGRRRDPFTGEVGFHEGLDIRAPRGTPVHASADGKVASAGRNGDLGLMVTIDHGDGWETRYAHVDEVLVKVGQLVKRGQSIARLGNSGRSTGPHLHYEVRCDGRPLDPMNHILRGGRIVD